MVAEDFCPQKFQPVASYHQILNTQIAGPNKALLRETNGFS